MIHTTQLCGEYHLKKSLLNSQHFMVCIWPFFFFSLHMWLMEPQLWSNTVPGVFFSHWKNIINMFGSETITPMEQLRQHTLRKTNIAPEKGWVGRRSPFLFRGCVSFQGCSSNFKFEDQWIIVQVPWSTGMSFLGGIWVFLVPWSTGERWDVEGFHGEWV